MKEKNCKKKVEKVNEKKITHKEDQKKSFLIKTET